MAEIGVAAAVIGIVGFALNLSQKLHHFAATTSAAGEEVGYIARNVTNYADALELLAERLDDGGKSIYSKHTVKVVDRLYDQSCDLFDRIDELIPEPKNGRDDLNFAQKVKWNFKKGRVEFLAGQIECLKTTTSLVATVLFAGKKIKSKRSRRKQKTKPDRSDLDQVKQRVTVAVVEQQQATDKLPDLQEKAIAEDRLALRERDPNSNHPDAEPPRLQLALVPLSDMSSPLQLRTVDRDGTTNQRQLILQENDDLFLYLLEKLTNIDIEDEDLPASQPTGAEDQAREYASSIKTTLDVAESGITDSRHPERSEIKSHPTRPQSSHNNITISDQCMPVPDTIPNSSVDWVEKVSGQRDNDQAMQASSHRPSARESQPQSNKPKEAVQDNSPPDLEESTLRGKEVKDPISGKTYWESETGTLTRAKAVYSDGHPLKPSPTPNSMPATSDPRSSSSRNEATSAKTPHKSNVKMSSGRTRIRTSTGSRSGKPSIPLRGTNLKHNAPQDAGYGSSSNPRTPEMRGESPPPSREHMKNSSNLKQSEVQDSGYYSTSRLVPKIRKESPPPRRGYWKTGSSLKQSEVQDSGNHSNSGPYAPDNKTESPPPSNNDAPPRRSKNSTKYQIIDPSNDQDHPSYGRGILESDDETNMPHRRYRSTKPERRDADRDRDKERRQGWEESGSAFYLNPRFSVSQNAPDTEGPYVYPYVYQDRDAKWNRHHQLSMAYIAESQRRPTGLYSKIRGLRVNQFEHLNKSCHQFVADPPYENDSRLKEKRRLIDMVMKSVIEPADSIDAQGVDWVRSERKRLIQDAQELIAQVESVGPGATDTPRTYPS